MNGTTAYALSKKYVEDTSISLGSLKGAPCTIKSITEVEGGQKVTFEWTGTSGTKQTSEMTVKNGVSVTGISDKGNGVFTLLFSDGSESNPIQTVKGEKGDKGDKLTFNELTDEEKASLKGTDGFSPTITENAGNTDKIYKLDITTADSTFTTPNLKGADGQGGSGSSGEENVIESIKVNGVTQYVAADKSVDISVPEAYDDTALAKKISDIESDYLKADDISGKVDKVDGKSLISDTEIARLASVDNYDDTQVKTQIQAVANGLMDSVGYSADYKTIDIIAKNGVKKSVNVAPIISHASITELSDVDTTNKATGKALVYNETTKKHEYANVSGTDEKVKMDASTDAKYLGELLDNITIANENGKLKVKKLDGQEVTITEINYLKGLTMNVMDLVNMFSNGGVKIINTPVATYAELLNLDKSSFIEGISYLVYVLADENHDNAKTTYLVDKDSKTPTYFGFADSQRDFVTNPIDLATEITGKLGISNMDSDAIKALLTVDDTYKTETTTNNAFSTHGAKALYDELLLAIGNKANDSDLTAHKDDTDIHVSTEDRTKWDSAKTHADSAHAPSNAQENVLETVKVNGTALTPSSKAVNVTVPTKVSELIDSADYAKTADIPTTLPANGGNSDTVNGHTVKSDVPENAVFTDTTYSDATQIEHGLMSVNDKKKLDGLKKYAPDGTTITMDEDATISVSSKALTFADHDTAKSGASFTDAEDGNMLVTDWTKNLVNPTLKTTTQNGVTCTNNGDGTYTLNGTATKEAIFGLAGDVSALYKRIVGKNVLFLNGGHKHNSKYRILFTVTNSDYTKWGSEKRDGDSFVVPSGYDLALIDIHVNSGTTVNNLVVKPMITFNLDATNDDFVPYGGYKIKSCGKNLLNPTMEPFEQFGVTCTRNVDANGKPDGTYTINGTSTKDSWFSFGYLTLNPGKYKFIATENNVRVNNLSVSLNGKLIAMPGEIFIIQSKCVCDIGISTMNKTFNNVLIKPMITTNLSATYDDFEPYTCETITVTNDTESPAFGLKSHKGITNIVSPGNVKCVYPTNESGKGVLDSLYNKDKMLTEQNKIKNDLGGLSFSASGTTLSITDGTNTWTLEANS